MAPRRRITRRQLLKGGAAGAAAVTMGAAPISFASPLDKAKENPRKLNSGIPHGGIGAGTVELRDDGLFHEWQIFGNWRHELLDLGFHDAFFALYTRQAADGKRAQVLSTQHRAGLPPVKEIRYTGRHPFAELAYDLDGPVDARLTAFTPFIPHDSRNSGLPTVIFEFDLTNRTSGPIEAAVAFCLQNLAVYGQPNAKPQISDVRPEGWNGLEMTADSASGSSAGDASVVVAAEGNAVSTAQGNPKDVLGHFAVSGVCEGTGPATHGTVSRQVALEAKGTAQVTFLLTWHFPRFIDAEKNDIGRMYSNWFSSAADTARYAISNLPVLESKTRQFRDVFYRSTLPEWLIDAVNAQFTTLPKSSWWTKDGTFAIWEGLGCCGTQTCDVAYYGSITLIALFPDLAKRAMQLSAAHQNPSGRIPHFFPGTFDYPDAYHMIDLMPKFTLMVWRDYLWTGDRGYLKQMWPHVFEAMEHNRALDRNGDFICDNHGIDQSYDGWEFEGASSYVGLINAVGFRAAACIAREMNQPDIAEDYDRLATIGAASLDRLLWNGEYYDLFYDIATGVRDQCCMSDQVNGQWFADLIELGRLLPDDRVHSALDAMYRHNRGPDYLRNGVWPKGTEPEHGGQWTAVWSGTEYMVASHMIYRGHVEQGLSVARTVYDRYAEQGRTWNHGECGDHYYRPLVALAILYAAQGFHYSAVDQRLVLKPCIEQSSHISPLITPLGWGELCFRSSESSRRLGIEVMEGEITLSSLEVDVADGSEVSLSVDGAEIHCTRQESSVSFPPVQLLQGSRLELISKT